MIRNFEDVISAARNSAPRPVVVAGAENRAVLEAVRQGQAAGFLRPVLVDEASVLSRLKNEFPEDTNFAGTRTGEEQAVAATAVAALRDLPGGILLKGSVSTAAVMRAVLDKRSGLPREGLLSDSFLFQDERRAGNQLIDITDGGVVLYPDLEQQQAILENAVRLYHALGHPRPRVAVCAAIERVNEKMPPTVQAAELKRRYQEGEITGCVVDGPLALDCALSRDALQIKGMHSELEGEADILVMPSIEAANLVAKSTQYIAGKEAAHVIMGAAAPVLIPSRSDTIRGKFLSLALAAVVSAVRPATTSPRH